MLRGVFLTALLNAALPGSLSFQRGESHSTIEIIRAATGSLPVQIFEDFDPSDVTRLIEAKERSQREITENDIVARFADEIENPHRIIVPHIFWQEYLDNNRGAFIKHLQYRPPNCGRPFDIFQLLDIVQDARRNEETRLLKEHSIAPGCTLKCCPPCITTTPASKKTKCPPAQCKSFKGQNKPWNPSAFQKLRPFKESDKEHWVNRGIPSEDTSRFVIENQPKKLPTDVDALKRKNQKRMSDEHRERSFQRHLSLADSGLSDGNKMSMTELKGHGADKYYSPEQKRRFAGSAQGRVRQVPRKWWSYLE